MGRIIEQVAIAAGSVLKYAEPLLSIAALGIAFLPFNHASAQSNEIETAKPSDAISPTGVSFTTGSFTYNLPILSIGTGEWPDRIDVILNYDSSQGRHPNTAWTYSTSVRASGAVLEPRFEYDGTPLYDEYIYSANFIVGNRSVTFQIQDPNLSLQDFDEASIEGNTLHFTGSGYFWPDGEQPIGALEFTSSDGNVLAVESWIAHGEIRFTSPAIVTMASGAVVEIVGPGPYGGENRPYYHADRISTSSGLVIVTEPLNSSGGSWSQRLCAYNLSYIDVASTTTCDNSSLVATVHFSDLYGISPRVVSVDLPNDSVYNFEYTLYNDIDGYPFYEGIGYSSRSRYHLSCIRAPGIPECIVQNTYDSCDGLNPGHDFNWNGSRDRVIQQVLGNGQVINYSYPGQGSACRQYDIDQVQVSQNGALTAVDVTSPNQFTGASQVTSVTDPLNRVTSYEWTGANMEAFYVRSDSLLSAIEYADERRIEYTYDNRGNVTLVREKAKPGSGLPDLLTSAVYPPSCPNPKTCNKPSSITDARENVTEFTYDPDHGGVLTVTGPLVDGVQPQTRYVYEQRHAWIKAGSGYAHGSTNARWMLVQEEFCRTSSADANGNCDAGAADEVVTTYDYGPDSGPNNLWLRGIAVTADGQTLRTCYGYDIYGRRISETLPNANLPSCP